MQKTTNFFGKIFIMETISFQVHIVVTSKSVKIYIDCYEIIEKDIKEAGNITTDGYEILGKLLKGERKSATVSNASFCFLIPCVKIDMKFSKQLSRFYLFFLSEF